MKKILVIEDHVDVRENLCEILELDGYQVCQAENGKVGVSLVRSESPDLIICDIMMPELDGYGVLKILSRDPETASIPFIFLTAKAEQSDFRKGMNLGADDYLVKPFDDTELLNTVERRIARKLVLDKQLAQSDVEGHQLADFSDRIEMTEVTQKERLYKNGSFVFNEGDPASHLYIVLEGTVICSMVDEYGKEFITGVHGSGDYFGFTELFEDGDREEMAVAKGEVKVGMIAKQDFLAMIGQHRDIAVRFIKLMAGQIQSKEQKLLRMAYTPVRERVAQTLIELWNMETPKVALNYSREQLSSMVGTAKESLIRTLGDLKSEGLITTEGRRIIVCNEEGLSAVAGLD